MSENKKEAVETATATATGKRTITVVSTKGEKKKIEFEGTTWSELKPILNRAGYSTDNMKCVESIKKTTLEHRDAVVPETDFLLFMMPHKSKSGGHTRSEIYVSIKELISRDGDKAKEHFTVDGKNYTMVSTDKLAELLESYGGKKPKVTTKEKAAAINDVVTSVKQAHKNGDKEGVMAQLQGLSKDEKIDLVIDLLLGIKAAEVTAEVKEKSAEEIQRENDVKAKALKEKEDLEAKEKARREKEEEEAKLDKELDSMMDGFSDVDKSSRKRY